MAQNSGFSQLLNHLINAVLSCHSSPLSGYMEDWWRPRKGNTTNHHHDRLSLCLCVPFLLRHSCCAKIKRAAIEFDPLSTDFELTNILDDAFQFPYIFPDYIYFTGQLTRNLMLYLLQFHPLSLQPMPRTTTVSATISLARGLITLRNHLLPFSLSQPLI